MMAAFLVSALGVAAGVIAGSVAARRAVRAEMDELRGMLRAQNAALPAAAQPAASVVPPVPALATQAPQPAPPAEVKTEEISPEILMVLSAAVAAFLGKRARIRRASLVPPMGASAWAQQGRVYVQASHVLNVRHR